MRVLIIEDDEATAAYIQQGVDRGRTHRSISPPTATDGLALAGNEEYQALIVDRMLPNLDGLSLIAALREDRRQNPGVDFERARRSQRPC